MRAVGLDLGERRIGVALSDSEGRLATPFDTVERTRDRQADHRRIAALVAEAEAEILVVGLPLSLDGSDGPAARTARREAKELERSVGVPVELYDERLTTVSAHKVLAEADLDGRRRRKVVDKVAASIMLQSWLDRRRDSPDGPNEERP